MSVIGKPLLTGIKIGSASGSVASWDGGIAAPLRSLLVNIEPVQTGTGDPSPDNVRPISGWTGAKVFAGGNNFYETMSYVDGYYIAANGTVSQSAAFQYCDYFAVSPGQTFVFRGYQTYSPNTYLRVHGYDASKNWVEQIFALKCARYDYSTDSFTIPAGISFIRYSWVKDSYSAGDTIMAFGTTYPITIPTPPGTVYGGELDVVNGKLRVTHGNIASYDGETLPGAWISSMDVYAQGTTPTTGAQVVYELAEPVEYDLTPEDITTLPGSNTLWADTGDASASFIQKSLSFIS